MERKGNMNDLKQKNNWGTYLELVVNVMSEVNMLKQTTILRI